MDYVIDFEVEYSSDSDYLWNKSVFSSDLIYQQQSNIRISMDTWRLVQAMIRTRMISQDLISTGKLTICREELEINTLG